jgi:predicted enzyme related to lactoylglutathione lyase
VPLVEEQRMIRRTGLTLAVWMLAGLWALPVQARDWPAIVETATDRHVPGRWVWGELVTPDVAAATDFYGAVLDWQFALLGAGDDAYTIVYAGGEAIGGILSLQPGVVDRPTGSRWIGLMSVKDVDAAAAAATAGGGRVLMTPAELDNRGRVALLADPEGAPFAVIRSAFGDPAEYAGDEGQWVWMQLWARQPDAAADFYRSIGGYELDREGDRLRLVSQGYARAGISRLRNPELSSAWLPWVRVGDLAATLARVPDAGGQVVLGPVPSPAGDPVAVVVDPNGAPFGLVEWPEDRQEVRQ